MPWPLLKKQIENHLKQDPEVFVTTLIDYYGVYKKHSFPKWDEAQTIMDKADRLILLEESMKAELEDDIRFRFIPYFQLHEFEGLLFNKIEIFRNNFTTEEANLAEIATIIEQHPNPELINDNRETAPSKRLLKLIKGYNKVVYGAILADEIGLVNIRAKCPRFNSWIELLEKQ